MPVQTVLGPVVPSDLGVTMTHEHLAVDLTRSPRVELYGTNRHADWAVLGGPTTVIPSLLAYKAAGGRAIVEVTTLGAGRDVLKYRAFAQLTGLHIIATTGFYQEPSLPPFAWDASVADLVRWMVKEIREGVDDTGIRCGVIKWSASSPRVEGVEAKCLEAAARAHLECGAPLTTHTTSRDRWEIEGGNVGPQFLDALRPFRVDLSRVIIGHTDLCAPLPTLLAILDRGAYAQFDLIGKEHYILDDTRADVFGALVHRGYTKQLLLASDRARETEIAVRGYERVLTNFIPRLRQRGVSDAALHAILVENPARVLNIS